MKKTIISSTLLLLATTTYSQQAEAAHVECLIGGTSTQQFFEPDFCSAMANTDRPSVAFRFIADKDVADVVWSYSASATGSWNCGSSTYCSFRDNGRQNNDLFYNASACVTKVLYKDGTWENTNYCANGHYSKQSSNPF
ncbi:MULTISPECIES: hypothetical protein [unclassified Pseudoalteromonas]|uniref:hypothetical protein n=1 Tax=unclassified Pseudoalteromonas TaxID=194690 RepID=UPI001F1C2EE6|nr:MULTISPECIES: hypothetical protein [unclassified Pseudoalteromonas]MCF2828576.1 hypothetical protein [Pseudoalteromonas sp. OF5H-5]MCF2834211.1 hypothetical protein [Pseudoalteromonas sp. DL2-H6]MCF2924820.1 hypothetical protein [Pseudoalteromonas sp. DL2-H1]